MGDPLAGGQLALFVLAVNGTAASGVQRLFSKLA
jgi:hypothetical protein